MEFDILNEILTCSVAQLFTDLSKHQNYMKTSSQMGQENLDIPKQIDPLLFSGHDSSSSGSYKIDFYAGSVGGGGSVTGVEETPVQQWLMQDAKLRLQEALQRLNLDSSKINGKHLISYTMEELNLEKKKVKNELKMYD